MALSDQEQRLLEEIESALYAEDPKFVSSVRGTTIHTSSTRRRFLGVILLIAGLVMLVAGIPLYTFYHGLLVLSVLGFLVMFAGGIYLCIHPATLGTSSEAPLGDPSGFSQNRSSYRSFTARMEDRFQRRFRQ